MPQIRAAADDHAYLPLESCFERQFIKKLRLGSGLGRTGSTVA
jgi:hypothetical protein